MVESSEDNMPELEVSVPLAKFDTEEWDEFSDFQSSQDPNRNKCSGRRTTTSTPDRNDNDFLDNMSDVTDTFKDTFSTSLEDLVNTFDDKITKCFHNYEDKVEKYAPVQVRSQEEIMNECQHQSCSPEYFTATVAVKYSGEQDWCLPVEIYRKMRPMVRGGYPVYYTKHPERVFHDPILHKRMWWTITGNFGNILPIDWSKTYTRQKYLPVLNLNEAKKKLEGHLDSATPSPRNGGNEDEDEVAHDLDLHQLILSGIQTENEPVKSAEEVIKEIDDMMQEGSSSEDEGIDASSSYSKGSSQPELQKLPPPLYHDKLKELSVTELNEAVMELELVVRQYSETLISQLAHRDELEYEKELKNTFISLLLQVQNKRRNFNVEKKKLKKPLNNIDPKYLTTVIPYDVGHGPPHNQTLQILIKILTAINEDSPTVPTLLTDYILKVLCPS